ncbi:MAG: class III signal peptide-containing protein [Candidatus Norongarragalinales archaeon]
MKKLKNAPNASNARTTRKAQTAIEYLILVGAIIAFITIIAYIVKERLFG